MGRGRKASDKPVKGLNANQMAVLERADMPVNTPTDKLNDEQKKEIRRERFIRLGTKRVNAVIKACKRVAALANNASYYRTEQQEAALVEAVLNAASGVQDAFSKIVADDKGFSF